MARKKQPPKVEERFLKAVEKLVEDSGATDLSFVSGKPERRGPVEIHFTEESLKDLRKRMGQMPAPDIEADGQGRLPGTPEPERRLPLYEVTLTAKSERIGYGSPAQPHEIEADHGEVTFLFEERVTRTVRVSVEADSYDDALERAQVKIDALVGGLHQLFADYPGWPTSPSWKVKKV